MVGPDIQLGTFLRQGGRIVPLRSLHRLGDLEGVGIVRLPRGAIRQVGMRSTSCIRPIARRHPWTIVLRNEHGSAALRMHIPVPQRGVGLVFSVLFLVDDAVERKGDVGELHRCFSDLGAVPVQLRQLAVFVLCDDVPRGVEVLFLFGKAPVKHAVKGHQRIHYRRIKFHACRARCFVDEVFIVHQHCQEIGMGLFLLFGGTFQNKFVEDGVIFFVAPLYAPTRDRPQGVCSGDAACCTRFKREQIRLRDRKVFFLGFLQLEATHFRLSRVLFNE